MLTTINKKYDNALSKLLLVIMFLWPLFFITKSIDHLDSGSYLTQYKYYFEGNVNSVAAIELSNLFGAIFYKVLPEAKFLSFRVLDWIANCVTWLFAYKIAIRSLPKSLSAVAVLAGSIFVRRYPMILSYNTFSFMLLCIAMYYLQTGIINKENKSIVISGAVIGFNVFFRLPNALQCLYVFIPMLSILSFSKDEIKAQSSNAFRQCLYFTIAGFIGLFAGFAICVATKGFSGAIKSISLTISLLNEGNHASSYMLERIKREYLDFKQYWGNLANYPYYILVSGIIFGVAKYKVKNRAVMFGLVAGLILVIAKFTSITVENLQFIDNSTIIVPYFISLIACVISLIFIRKNNEAFITVLMFTFLMLIFPIGTDNGIMHSCLFMYIVFLNFLVALNGFNLQNKILGSVIKSIFTLVSILIILTFGMGGTKNILLAQSYNDGPRSKQTYSVNVPTLRGMQTVETRAEAIQSLYDELESLEEFKDRELLMLGNCPLAYAITDFKPFAGEFWPDLEYVDKEKILEDLNSSKKFPIIVVAKFNSTTNTPEYIQKILDFAAENGYSKLEREYFSLYLPN